MDKAIEVKNLIKRYRKAKVNAIDDISFSVENGEFFTMLGPNGAGKTTTVSVLNTTLAKTSGTVMVAGKEIDQNPAKVRKQIGVIFQNPSLDVNLTAEENVRFHAILYGLYPYRPTYNLMPLEYQQTVNKLATILGLTKEIHQPIKSFSGGMKRKLEIVRGLIHKPRILFLDEPTTGLDPIARQNLWQYLKEVRKKDKITLFLTTHYLEEAEDSDRICVINQGKIVALGTPNEIKKNLVDEYLIIDADNRDGLRKELNDLRLKFREEKHFLVDVNSNRLQELMRKLKTKLTFIKIHSPSLEEAYLEIISRQGNNENN